MTGRSKQIKMIRSRTTVFASGPKGKPSWHLLRDNSAVPDIAAGTGLLRSSIRASVPQLGHAGPRRRREATPAAMISGCALPRTCCLRTLSPQDSQDFRMRSCARSRGWGAVPPLAADLLAVIPRRPKRVPTRCRRARMAMGLVGGGLSRRPVAAGKGRRSTLDQSLQPGLTWWMAFLLPGNRPPA
jgi:hypothetical protein